MHFISEKRYNPLTSSDGWYYRIKETFRDYTGKVRSRILLNVGFVETERPEDIRDAARGLNYMMEHRGEAGLFGDPFAHYSEATRNLIDQCWRKMVELGTVDTVRQVMESSRESARRMIDSEAMEHTDARELGAEWVCLQAIRQLKIDSFLRDEGWSEAMLNAALSHLTVRTVYSPSEWKTLRLMRDNSSACELVYGEEGAMPGLHTLYGIAPALYALKEKLERHLCAVTDNLFNLQNRIVLFDLTNFYFEGAKRGSKKAKFGRSKEKRGDCRLLVLALCINTDGFIRHSEVLPGNTADPKSLPSMVDSLMGKSPVKDSGKTLVVIDAGIATEENLALLKEKGYNYLCVSRTRLKDYELSPDRRSVTVLDARKQAITLREVHTDPDGDYYLEVTSPSKAMTEASMNRQWRERFEGELEKINGAIKKKGGTKSYEKVIERTGRTIQKYPSVSRYYAMEYVSCEENPSKMERVEWSIRDLSGLESGHGVYFLRTNVRTLDEKTTWDYYNLIREIECTNRQLKTDLNLRPIYHQTDDNSDAHLFLGLLSYWIVNTIRTKLKQGGMNHYWTEYVRILSTQKLVTTESINPLGEKVVIRQSTKPSPEVNKIYEILNYKKQPPKKRKICSTQ